jgi:diadenosine tetraphosphatase ApaH/serine/threonine PP2A family protein phosphatase
MLGSQAVAVVGDVHGCATELDDLLALLGRYDEGRPRHVVFVGDLTDRGPDSVGVLVRVAALAGAGRCTLIRGNHDDKLRLTIDDPRGPYGGDRRQTLRAVLAAEAGAPGLLQGTRRLLDRARDVVEWLDVERDERVIVTHAGLPTSLAQRVAATSAAEVLAANEEHFTRAAIYAGGPGRDSAAEPVTGLVQIHGHTPTAEPLDPSGPVVNVDTGVCFGGRLSAWLWPEREIVSVPARATYRQPPAALAAALRSALGSVPGVGLAASG